MPEMRASLHVLNAIVTIGAISALVTWYAYGTISPCGVLRERVRNEGIDAGGFVGALSTLAPDSLVDALIKSEIGGLTPKTCLGAILDGRFNNSPTAQSPIDRTSRVTTPSNGPQEPCISELCTRQAEEAAKRTYAACAANADRKDLNDGHFNKCNTEALAAWQATGALSPYAHPCPVVDAQVDYIGRCK